MYLRGTDLRSAGRERVLPGCWQPARPASAAPVRDRTSPTAPFAPRPACLSRRTIPAWNHKLNRTAAPVFTTGNAGNRAPVRTAGRAGLSVVSFPALPAVALQGGPVPAHVNPVISHRHPDICPDETRGRAIPPAQTGAGPPPGNNGVAPANRTGPAKPDTLIDAAICRTSCAERVREFRAQGTGF